MIEQEYGLPGGILLDGCLSQGNHILLVMISILFVVFIVVYYMPWKL